MNAPSTLQQAIRYFTDFENCKDFMIQMRWPDGKIRCPTCNSDHVDVSGKGAICGNATRNIRVPSSRSRSELSSRIRRSASTSGLLRCG